MNITLDFVALLNGIILLAIGIGVRYLAELSRKINIQNNRISHLEGWREEHERSQAELLVGLRQDRQKDRKD